jgi:pantoate--beta-alanine ligase
MEIFKQIAPLKAYLRDVRMAGKSVGLVPTMGALHEGHLALIKASQRDNERTVCTIFVNPTQFNNPADLLKYPRTLDRDTELLKEVRCDVVFCPENDEIYPEKPLISFDFGTLDKVMEGKFRPGHFSGVAMVVSKLFNIVEPDHAYFGQKDWQQFAVVSKLVQDLSFKVKLHGVPTLREADGLALSSRNQRLNASERKEAVVFYQMLQQARKELHNGSSIQTVKEKVVNLISQKNGIRLEYFEIADSKNLNLLENVERANRPILCIAGFVGEVRLIDNLLLFDE